MQISTENIQFSGRQRPQRRSAARRFFGVLCCVGAASAGSILAYLNADGTEIGTVRPEAPRETISYGSRVGMDLTIISKRNIGTSNATITAEKTRDDAASYCENYIRDFSKNCIKQQLADNSLAKSISADCALGVFTSFDGDRYRRIANDAAGKFIDLKTGGILDGSSASGLSYVQDQFNALCPGSLTVRPPLPPQNLPISENGNKQKGREVRARGSGVLPGAIICQDLQTVSVMRSQYARHWEETFQDKVTRGQSLLIRGQPAASPDLAAFGCAFVSSGDKMTLEAETPIPIVSALLPDGGTFRGVTFSYMYGSGNSRSPF